ncbi:MAG: cation diffusion facilitator family transporter [Halobacteriota archaeon]|nr:cation diffusion facilitator family transporter [Halobacteriota archaeon]
MNDNCGSQNISQINKITWVGVLLNLFLSFIKFLVGYLGASQAVIADAVHSLSDLSTDLAVIFGIRFWSAPPDKDHPYGHRRIEALVTISIGLILAICAIGIGYEALVTIREVHIEQTSLIAAIGPLISIILKEVLHRWTINVGRRTKSSAVIANAWHHRSDALSSVPALIAVTASSINPDWAFIDHIGALIIALFILKVSRDTIGPSISELIDGGVSDKDRETIKEIVLDVKGVIDVHAIRTRKLGPNLCVDLHILVDPDISVRTGHDISEEVQKLLIEEGPEVIDVVVHIEPDE